MRNDSWSLSRENMCLSDAAGRDDELWNCALRCIHSAARPTVKTPEISSPTMIVDRIGAAGLATLVLPARRRCASNREGAKPHQVGREEPSARRELRKCFRKAIRVESSQGELDFE